MKRNVPELHAGWILATVLAVAVVAASCIPSGNSSDIWSARTHAKCRQCGHFQTMSVGEAVSKSPVQCKECGAVAVLPYKRI